MDFLKSLNLEDLPEQQTRLRQLTESQPDFQLNLGFDACCTCGKSDPKLKCPGCHRVKYCSKECRDTDSAPPMDDDEEPALGHSSVICALLALCNDDEALESKTKPYSSTDTKMSSAMDRLASEYESYPATLANVVMDGPCFQDVLRKRAGDSLTIHIIGASSESELWEGHPESTQVENVFKCYGEALAEIAAGSKLKNIHLCFIGPECPKSGIDSSFPIQSDDSNFKSSCILKVTSIQGDYNNELLKTRGVPPADIVVFFNPGFTCPDYTWDGALECLTMGTPYLVTTNTELEGIADVQYLLEKGLIEEIPVGLAQMLQDGDTEMAMEDNDSFFSVNPFSGSRVRQSGTMGNDLYVKSRWMFGGCFGKNETKRETGSSSKKQRIEGSGNTKQSNPALI